MVEIVDLSAGNERPVADRLAASIRSAWPDVASSLTDRVTIVIGSRVAREIDLMLFLELGSPRDVPSRLRRDGSRSPVQPVQGAAIVLEVKQLERSRFTIVGTQIFPDYHGAAGERSVNAQVDDCTIAIRTHAARYGIRSFYTHGVAWLTDVPAAELASVNPWIVGEDAGWFDILDAAAQQSASIYGAKSTAVLRDIATIRDTLTRRRPLSPRDKAKSYALCHETIANELIDDLVANVGTQQLRLTGRGGSGKTTTLALLAKRLATIEGDRVLILTFHKTLRADIAHLIDSLVDIPGVRPRIRVETATTFFVDALQSLAIALPLLDGKIDFARVSDALRDARNLLASDAELMPLLRASEAKRFDYDYVFVDEAQDWTDDERDFLRVAYGSRNLVLADGLEQLVRRQTACDWHAGLAKADRSTRHLGRSLRMTANVAAFANAFARELGMRDWSVKPLEELPGGRIVVIEGSDVSTPSLFGAIRALLASADASPVDALVCVPPTMVHENADGRRESTVGAALRATGFKVWDASEPGARDTSPTDADAWRIVQYDSCRGLEGWITVAYGLDELVATKKKHPNLAPGETDTPENVAARWLMIALTRAVHMLIVTVTEPDAPIVSTLRAAANSMPNGVVEWTTAEACVERLSLSYGAARSAGG